MRSALLATFALVAFCTAAQAQFGGSPSPGAPSTSPGTTPATPPTAPGAPKMIPPPPQSNPTLPPASPGSNVPARNPIEAPPPAGVQPPSQPNPERVAPAPNLPAIPGGSSLLPMQKDASKVDPAAQEKPSPPLSRFAACMQLWDKETKISKRAWAADCHATDAPRGWQPLDAYVAKGGSRRSYRSSTARTLLLWEPRGWPCY